MLVKDGLDGKKNGCQRGCHENALIECFEKSPHLMGLADYPYNLFIIQPMDQVWMRLAIKGM